MKQESKITRWHKGIIPISEAMYHFSLGYDNSLPDNALLDLLRIDLVLGDNQTFADERGYWCTYEYKLFGQDLA